MPSQRTLTRRQLVKTSAALTGLAVATPLQSVFAQPQPMRTTDQIMGPFYPVDKPLDQDADLTTVANQDGQAEGQVIHLMGRVVDTQGNPIPDVRIEIWQANAHGRYSHPSDTNTAPLDPNFHGFGVQTTDAQGQYRFKTIKPGPYPVGPITRTPHIHVDIAGPKDRLVTQMYFAGEALNDNDVLLKGAWNKETLIAKVLPPTQDLEPDSLLVQWDIVLGWQL